MGPVELYRTQLADGRLLPDAAQAGVVRHFQSLHDRMLDTPHRNRPGLIDRLRRRPVDPLPGIYLWGGVGRGKTWLMDLFFHGLPFRDKRRMHFHFFMAQVHRELDRLKGQRDPLQSAAERFAESTRVLCLDELQVWDIGDAMILGGLLDALFRRGVTLVTTSNNAPDELYPNGLQRSRFLPAIESMKTHTRVVHLESETDYRLRFLETAETYHFPLDDAADAVLDTAFGHIAPETGESDTVLTVNGRSIPVRRRADSVLWADFSALCDAPRNQADYLEVARGFHTVLIAGVPRMDDGRNDQARRFINLVDVLYDHNVTLVLTAETGPDDLYAGQTLAFEFRRTASRLREMQSREWMGRTHSSGH